jgi:nucleotide-binding universal stress UspA family protein
MEPFHRILFPVDFSGAGAALAPTVAAIARQFKASVTVVNAFNLVHDYNLTPVCNEVAEELLPIPYIPAFQELRDQRERRLEEFANEHFPDLERKSVIVDGEPALAIEWLAKRERADLITLPTRGLGRFRRMLLGSVTAKVLHDIDCPVFTAAHEPGHELASPYNCKSILCALKFDSGDELALRMTASLARSFGARVCLLHILTKNDEQEQNAAMESARQAFQQIASADGGSGIPMREKILDASIPEGIRQTAIEEEADLVVVGRGHAREGISFLWSRLYTIIRESPCPVLST